VLEFAARSAPNFGEAMQIMARYLRIMIESVEYLVTVEGEYATWKMRPLPPVVFPPAANDYAIASSLAFSRRNSTGYKPPIEVRLMHERPEYADEYEKLLETKASFGAPYNMIVIHKSRLDAPMLGANPNTAEAFQLQAQRVLAKLRDREGFSGRVREGLAQELRAGSASMQKTARRLGMGVATLRRRLEQESTTFSEIVDELRKQLAERHLAEVEPTISEVAFLLGFSDVRAFGRAFRRWTGKSPSEYRTSHRR
jgi:AraC-like DNA-binding protein